MPGRGCDFNPALQFGSFLSTPKASSALNRDDLMISPLNRDDLMISPLNRDDLMISPLNQS
jgi:hypothetical protein